MRTVVWMILLSLVFAMAAQAQEAANYFVEAEVSNLTPFVGQQVTYTFRVYSKVARTEQGSIVDPDFVGFWQQQAGPVQRYTTFVGNESYEVTERDIALFPAYAGTIVIEPATLLIPGNPSYAGEVLRTDSLTLNVSALPAPPDSGSFDGAVGQFTMEPTVDRQEVHLGEPVTLHLTIRGDGNVEQLPAPQLAESDVWHVFKNPSAYQDEASDGVLTGQKTFEWLLTAVEPGAHALPEVTFTYFEPSSQSYRSISSLAIPVAVLPSEREAAATPVLLPTAEPLPLKPLPASLVVGRSDANWWWWLLWILPPLAALGAWLEMRRRQERQRNADAYQRSEALKRALGMLAQAGRSNQPYRIVREALLTYFADKMNMSSHTLSYLDIENALRQRGLETEPGSAVAAYLEQIDRALYAPGETPQNPEMIQEAARILEALDIRWVAR